MAHWGKQLGAAHGVITSVLEVALILTAAAIFFRGRIVDFFARRAGPANPRRTTALTILLHAVPLTLLAGLGHWMMGSVDWRLLISPLSGSIPGIVIGSLLSARAPDKVLRPILASTMGVVGLKMFF